MEKFSPKFQLFYRKEERAWYLTNVSFCCTALVQDFDRGIIHIAGFTSDMDKYRVILNYKYIVLCPYCAAPIDCVCSEKGQEIFHLLMT